MLIIFLIFTLGVLFHHCVQANFPLRGVYPEVQIITTENLNNDYDQAIIVDVRSKFEFDIVNIYKALHIPVTVTTFEKDIEQLRNKTGSQPMVFYCNGYECPKSYEAAKRIAALGFGKVYCYDAGIFNWIQAHPEKGVMMGKTPIDKGNIISKEKFEKRTSASNTVTIDIREPFLREKIPHLPKLRKIPLDRLLSLIESGKFKDKQLLILDAVQRQVRWLQYHLEFNGYQNYYFLKDGVNNLT